MEKNEILNHVNEYAKKIITNPKNVKNVQTQLKKAVTEIRNYGLNSYLSLNTGILRDYCQSSELYAVEKVHQILNELNKKNYNQDEMLLFIGYLSRALKYYI